MFRSNSAPIKAGLALALTVSSLVSVAAPSAAQTTPQTTQAKMVMDWAFEGAQAIWTSMAESGCLAKSGLEVKIDRGFGSSDAITKVASGAYDIGVADFASIVNYDATHPDNRVEAVFLVSDRSPTSVTVLKTSGITKPKDLEGKRIADSQGEASRALFPAFAKANGIDLSKITWVNVSPDLRQTSLVQGKADAAAGHLFTVQTGLQALNVDPSKYFSMAYASYGVDLPGSAVIVKPEWANAHRPAMRAFLNCAATGIKSSIADPQAALTTLHHFNSLSDAKSDAESLAFSTSFAIVTPGVKQRGLSGIDPKRMNAAIDTISSALDVPRLPLNSIWDPSFLPSPQILKVAAK